MPKCGRAVPTDYFRKFLQDEEKQNKFEEWYVRSYVDDNPVVKWCTNPAGCELACEYQGGDQCEIKCGCGFISCWSCGEESHRPADCKTVHQWNIKNSAESENISWIRANTKKCPKCHKPIEKNQGCNHMICSKAGGCGHEFCWLCLGDWHQHGTSTGGYYQCNIYDKQHREGVHVEEEQSRQKAKHALDKYMFFFERFMDHDRGMKLTVKQEVDIERHVQTLHDKHGFEIIELQFLFDALQQVRHCRRVLKWSYVYGYYLEDGGPEKNLFEFLQKNLEAMTDQLHEKLEKDLEQTILNDDKIDRSEAHAKFMDFRSKVSNYTLVSNTHLAKFLTDVGGVGGLIMGCPNVAPNPSAAVTAPRRAGQPSASYQSQRLVGAPMAWPSTRR
jgi:ariadne-1